jgi:hypothetical protein
MTDEDFGWQETREGQALGDSLLVSKRGKAAGFEDSPAGRQVRNDDFGMIVRHGAQPFETLGKWCCAPTKM